MGKTRYSVKAFGEERQIFSVRELPDGSISIIFNLASSGFTGDEIRSCKNFHITIHKTQFHKDRKCHGNRIKHSLLTNENEYFHHSIIIRSRKNNDFILAVTSSFNSALIGDSYIIKRKKGDSIVPVIGYLGAGETFSHTIYVCEKNVVMPRVQGFGKVERTFNEFKLVLYFTFFHISGGMLSFVQTPAKGALRVGTNPSRIIGNAQDPAAFSPMSLTGIERFLQKTHFKLSCVFMDFIKNGPENLLIKEISTPFDHAGFNRWPAYTDEVHEAYGEEARINNEIYHSPTFIDGTPKPENWQEPLGLIRTQLNSEETLMKHGVKPRLPR